MNGGPPGTPMTIRVSGKDERQGPTRNPNSDKENCHSTGVPPFSFVLVDNLDEY